MIDYFKGVDFYTGYINPWVAEHANALNEEDLHLYLKHHVYD